MVEYTTGTLDTSIRRLASEAWVFFVVAALWAFAAMIVDGQWFYAEVFFVTGNLILGAKIVSIFTEAHRQLYITITFMFILTISYAMVSWVELKKEGSKPLNPMSVFYVFPPPPPSPPLTFNPASPDKLPAPETKIVRPANGSSGPNQTSTAIEPKPEPPPLPRIVVKNVEPPSGIESGKDPLLKVDIALQNSPVAVTVRQYKATGVWTFHKDDPAAQRKEEDALWDWFMSHIPTLPILESQIPSNNDTLSLPSNPLILSVDDAKSLKLGNTQVYYLFYVIDEKNRPLLEFCGRIDDTLAFNYCSFHNGP
jgi:hypothetical protein